jgi:hypothetical protein
MLSRLSRALCLFCVFAALLGIGMTKAGIAEAFSDPVTGIRAQDESEYANGALRMATQGGWLTPRFMGRYWLIKPPLLVWLAALSLKLLGISLLAFRLPVLLVGAGTTLLLFYWSEKAHSLWTAAATGLLLVSNPVWHTLSRIGYTDVFLAAAISAAMFTVWRDPQLSRSLSILSFAGAVSAGVMAKNVAGLLPVLTVILFYLLTGRRPTSGLWKVGALVLLTVAPWHIYQLWTHGRWFWTDYVQIQLLGFGLHPPVQFKEGAVPFYLKRLFLTDPVLSVLTLAALPLLVRSAWERKTEAALLLSWMLVIGAALFAFQYRNLPYLCELLPPLSLAAAGYGPLAADRRRQKVLVGVLAAAFCAKVTFGGPAWALSYSAPVPLPSAEGLHWYTGLSRSNELIAVNSDDEFSASVLPLVKIRYCFIDQTGTVLRYAPHYGFLGITVSAAQFDELDKWEPQFRERLLQWGLDSVEPVATTIVANSAAEVVRMIAAHPRSDFYLPARLWPEIGATSQTSHRIAPLASGRFFLLALKSGRATGKLLRLE